MTTPEQVAAQQRKLAARRAADGQRLLEVLADGPSPIVPRLECRDLEVSAGFYRRWGFEVRREQAAAPP